MAPRESPRPRPRERSHKKRRSEASKTHRRSAASSQTSSQALSADALAKLELLNERRAKHESGGVKKSRRKLEETPTKPKRKRERVPERDEERERRRERKREGEILDEKKYKIRDTSRKPHKQKKGRVVSGALLEEGSGEKLREIRGLRGGVGTEDGSDIRAKRKRLWMCIGVFVVLLIIIIAIAVSVSSKKHNNSSSSSSLSSPSESGTPSTSNLDGMSESEIPEAARGTYLDPFTWYDTVDFNVTYTNDTVGGLPIMGLNSTWDDSMSANSKTAPIKTPWGSYATKPVRGVNLGGWLSLEPFITPSLFNYDPDLGIIDEWTLTTHLGASGAQSTLEKHYATFVTEQTFIDIANAGLDHVRIPFSYWAVTTYTGDPYVFRTSWRYLLRGIEWARKHGLRINLDLHALPGSQNGWNHSGRQGAIGWLNGTNGDTNAQRSLDIHNQLSQFFAQPRYKNIITFYGLVNEPRMTALNTTAVLSWTASAYELIAKNGISAYVVFGDGFMGLENWQGKLQGYSNLVLDVHQYVIFNQGQIAFNHTTKVNYACTGWTQQAEQSMSTSTGFGPTMFAEWSQADTDCAPNLNNVNMGSRWLGTYDSGDPLTEALSPLCPAKDSTCECSDANANFAQYSSTYKDFLLMFAEAQMTSFEAGWGWFYWTWVTEQATQWSYQFGLQAGILPALAYERDFDCTQTVPSFSGLPETY